MHCIVEKISLLPSGLPRRVIANKKRSRTKLKWERYVKQEFGKRN